MARYAAKNEYPMKKYKSLFLVQFASSLEYRASLVGTVLQETVSVISVILLWLAIYRSQSNVSGYSFANAVAYYLLVPIVGFMTQIVLSDRLGQEIKNGFFSNYLLRPARFWLAAFMGVLAGKVSYLILVSPVIGGIIIYLLLSGAIHFSIATVLPALCIVVLAFVFHFVLDLALSFSAFWFDDVWAFWHIKNIVFSVLGGVSFPLDFVRGPLHTVLNVLPFQYLYYVPIAYLSGKRPMHHLVNDMILLLTWMVAIIMLGAFLWRYGLKRYGAYGR